MSCNTRIFLFFLVLLIMTKLGSCQGFWGNTKLLMTVVLRAVMWGVDVVNLTVCSRGESPSGTDLWLEILTERRATWNGLTEFPLVKRKIFWVQNFQFNILAISAKAKHWAILGSLNSCPKFPLLSVVVNSWPGDIRTSDLCHAILSSNLFNVLLLGYQSLVVLSSFLVTKLQKFVPLTFFHR